MAKSPILIVIPHGGYQIPEEFAEHTELDETDLLLSADTGANELFSIESCAAVLSTHISRLFIDLDRSPMELPPRAINGVMKDTSFFGEKLFPDDHLPDHIALANILKRYYLPFHETLRKIITSGEISLVIECHTVAAVGGARAKDRDQPRPIVSIQNRCEKGLSSIESAPADIAESMLAQFRKALSGEDCAAEKPFTLSDVPIDGHLIHEHAGNVPWLRINLSRGLFLNDVHFNYDYGKIDQIRIGSIRKKIEECIIRGTAKK